MSPLYGSVIFNMVLKLAAEGERPKSTGCGRVFFFFKKLIYFVLSTHFIIYLSFCLFLWLFPVAYGILVP